MEKDQRDDKLEASYTLNACIIMNNKQLGGGWEEREQRMICECTHRRPRLHNTSKYIHSKITLHDQKHREILCPKINNNSLPPTEQNSYNNLHLHILVK